MKYALGLAAALGVSGCGGGDDVQSPPIGGATESATLTHGSTLSASGDPTGTGTDTETGTATEGSSTGGGPTNCAELQCSGPGSCETAPDGEVYCACDEGYRLDAAGTTCVVDESCIKVRYLEDRCRQYYAGPPAVSLFFGLDFCAGTAVTPDKLAELGISFLVLENDVDVAKNVESSVQLVPIEVESYVNLVIDVSDSLTQNEEFLPGLVEALHGLVDALEPQAGEPDVHMAVYVFARGVAEYVPFTRNLGTIRSALDVLRDDPGSVVDLAGGGMGTDLFEATKEGIENTQRIRLLRDAVTWGGVLSTGTVVIITDGKDASNGMLDQGLVDNTVNQVISVGLGVDIDDEQLRRIGRDGNFLAPTGADLATAFAEITTRVEQYPLRSYMLAYCSSTSEGTPTVEVSLEGGALSHVTSAACRFDAELFSNQAFECNADLFANECNAAECGGLTACGACPDDQCCDGTSCQAPSTADVEGISCSGQPHLCGEGRICVGSDCVDAAEPGFDHGELSCPPGCPNGYTCEDQGDDEVHNACVPAAPVGSPCQTPSQCESLNCWYVDEDNPFEGRRCLPEARIFDHCGSADAICEVGSSCEGSTCEALLLDAESCSQDKQCRHGVCADVEVGSYCAGTPRACYWSWDQKVPS